MAENGWVIVCKEMNPYVAGRGRLVARICPIEQTVGKVQGGKLHIVLRNLISEALIVELSDGSLEIQASSQTFRQLLEDHIGAIPSFKERLSVTPVAPIVREWI